MKVTVCYNLMLDLDFTEEEIKHIKSATNNLQGGDYANEIARSKSKALCDALDAFDNGEISGVYTDDKSEDEIIWEA